MPKLNIGSPSNLSKDGKNTAYDLQYRGNAAKGRVPVMMSTRTSNNPIKFWVNPNECSWRIATRTTIEQIQGGAVHHEWRSVGVGSQKASKFDQPVVNFSFQSGLILPNGTNDTGDNSTDEEEVAPGLANFYDFLELLNQPTVTTNGQPNYVTIHYVSSIFPSLSLKGYFSAEGVQWSDTADNPNMVVGWGASFVVFSSNPDLFDAGSLKTAFKQAYFQG